MHTAAISASLDYGSMFDFWPWYREEPGGADWDVLVERHMVTIMGVSDVERGREKYKGDSLVTFKACIRRWKTVNSQASASRLGDQFVAIRSRL